MFLAAIVGGSWSVNAQVLLKDEPRPSEILLGQTDFGVVFTDSRGRSLYSLDADIKPGFSACTSAVRTHGQTVAGNIFPYPIDKPQSCLGDNPPVVAKDAKPIGAFSVINRPDGIKQWAYNGRALYTSVKDTKPGDVFGGYGIGRGGRGGGLPAFAPMVLPPEIRVETVGTARVMTNQAGFTLYTYALDERNKSICAGSCESTWKPVIAPTLARASGDWTLVARPDKSRQWAFKGKPVYTNVNDLEPATTSLYGTGNTNWQVLLAHPIPKLPSGFTIQLTGIGKRYANALGKTLYAFSCVQQANNGEGGVYCDDPADASVWWRATCGPVERCADTWRPVVADKNATPVGNIWTIVTLPKPWAPVRAMNDSDSDIKVWAYRGKPLFTYKYEDEAGMIEGEDIGYLGPMSWNSIPAVDLDSPDPYFAALR